MRLLGVCLSAVAFVGYSGGLLAIEQLRQVFNELDAHTLREYVSFPRYYLSFDEEGRLRKPEEPAAAAQTLLDRLHWWAEVLAVARRVPVAASQSAAGGPIRARAAVASPILWRS